MRAGIAPQPVRRSLQSRPRTRVKPHRPFFEPLEERMMLSGASAQLPLAIVLGRTQSAPISSSSPPTPVYFVGEVPSSDRVVDHLHGLQRAS